jgi:hypothetical protein
MEVVEADDTYGVIYRPVRVLPHYDPPVGQLNAPVNIHFTEAGGDRETHRPSILLRLPDSAGDPLRQLLQVSEHHVLGLVYNAKSIDIG